MAQVVGPDGTVYAASANLAGRPAVADLEATGAPSLATFEAPDDEEVETYRVWYASGESPSGPVTVYVGSSLETVDEATSALRRTLWLGVPLAVAALGLVTWVLIGRVLARLDRIRAEVDLISATSLDRRVADDGASDEVGRLARTMNAMLGRLETSARRQREFVADVSHDLQSPLTGQRTTLELALARPDETELRTLCVDMLGATGEMERLVGDLLVLASVDGGVPAEPTLFDLDELVLEEATRLRAVTTVRIDTARVSAAPAYAHPGDVRRIVRNLLENAVAHATQVVEVVVGAEPDLATLDVLDDGPGIDPGDRERVFDRFYRADAARSRGGGSGLGLAIARSLAERSGGDVRVLDSAGGAHLRLTLPTSAALASGPCPASSDVVDLLHGWYPPATADSWDAVGLVAGDPGQDVRKVLFAVDPAPAVAQEAAEWGADLLVVHHPLFLKPVHGIARTTPKARTLGVLLDAGCALLTAHTNADQAVGGVSEALATTLGLTNLSPVVRPRPLAGRQAHRLRARRRRREAPRGARRCGRRDDRRLRLRVVQHARARAGSGRPPGRTRSSARSGGSRSSTRSGSRWCSRARGVRPSSPRCWRPTPTRSRRTTSSSSPPRRRPAPGRAGSATSSRPRWATSPRVVAERLPATAGGVRVGGDPGRPVRRVAVCGGAGDFMLDAVLATDADVYVTSDLRHHPASEFLEKGGPALVDVSHWAAEWTWLPVVEAKVREALGDTVETRVSTVVTDPWQGASH